jgi:hypothetical protein
MAQIQFFANSVLAVDGPSDTIPINHQAGSGLGFYGSNFGISVPIREVQKTTFVTDANGIVKGTQLHNTAAANVTEPTGLVSINGSSPISNNNLPNHLCPLNIRFTNDTPVRVQNCRLRIFDRNNISNPASGVTTYVYEARHPSVNQNLNGLALRGTTGADAHSWRTFEPTDGQDFEDMIFTSSPGASGLNTSTADTDVLLGYTSQEDILHQSLRHDWYVAISSEPESIGSKTNYGLYFSVEYL